MNETKQAIEKSILRKVMVGVGVTSTSLAIALTLMTATSRSVFADDDTNGCKQDSSTCNSVSSSCPESGCECSNWCRDGGSISYVCCH